MKSRFHIKVIIALGIGIALLGIPLLGNLHFESALLAALLGCFWAGDKACQLSKGKGDFLAALRLLGYLYIVALPLLLYSLLAGCFSIHGVGFWVLFPFPSVLFGYAVGKLVRHCKLPMSRLITAFILLAIALGTLLYEFLSYPQVYFFNHVWGGWPGPIYDESVTIDRTTIFFRSMTLVWAILLWHIPFVYKEKKSLYIVLIAAASLAFCYTRLAKTGVISPNSYIQDTLGGHKETNNFRIYYDRESYSSNEISLLIREHEFYLHQITKELALEPDSIAKIESYLYGDPWQKKRLVGAKFTSYVPIWLSQDQLHIAKQQLGSSLKHELVHVLAKQFGNKLFNGSWSIGLIEGLAVAIDGGHSPSTTIDQIVVSEKPYPTAKELRHAFSFWGFYGGRSAVNYTTSGSFVQYLLNNYPVKNIKKAYREGSIKEGYRQDWQELTEGWYNHLSEIKTDSVDKQTAARLFSIPSLLEQECPHIMSSFASAMDDYQRSRARRDTSKALGALGRALIVSDSLPSVKTEWSYWHLIAGNPLRVQQAATRQDTTIDLQLLYADAFMVTGDSLQAQQYLEKAQELFARQPDSLRKPAIETRTNPWQWRLYRQLTYRGQLPDSTNYTKALYRTKVRGLRHAIERERWTIMIDYARQLLKQELSLRYFDSYLTLIHHLGFQGEKRIANHWVQKLEQKKLRNRYQERLEQEKQWLRFIE